MLVGAGDLLHAIFSHYPDIDVKDQAVFYYNLLLHLSTDKVSSITPGVRRFVSTPLS